MVTSANSDDIEKRLAHVGARNGRCCYLSHLGLSDATLPIKALLSYKLTKLDLGFNYLQHIPASIGNLTSLRELWLNDNPHLLSVPVSLSNLTNLRVLDLRGTALTNIPREYAVLTKLKDVNLTNCPLKASLQSAYANGRDSFFQYLRRKNDRRIYKEKLRRIFHDDIYPFDDMETTLKPLVDLCFAELKDKTTPELRKLIRHGPRIFPGKAADTDPKKVRLAIEGFVQDDIRTAQTGFLQLSLRGIYPGCSVGDAAQKARDIYKIFGDRPKDWKRLFGKEQKIIFPPEFKDLSGMALWNRMEEMKAKNFKEMIMGRIGEIYTEATEDERRSLFTYFLECCEHDWDLLDKNLEKTIPPDLTVALEKMEEGIQFYFSHQGDHVEEEEFKEEENIDQEGDTMLP